jgi:hypothetical protein
VNTISATATTPAAMTIRRDPAPLGVEDMLIYP